MGDKFDFISDYTPITEERVEEIIDSARNGNIELRNEIVLGYLKMVMFVARKFTLGFSNTVDRQDLFQSGILGIYAAIDTWDKTKGSMFSSYVFICIKTHMIAILATDHPVHYPRAAFDLFIKSDYLASEFYNEYGFYPSLDEIADYAGSPLSVKNAFIAMRRGSISGNQVVLSPSTDDETELFDIISDPHNLSVSTNLEYESLLSEIKKSMNDREYSVFRRYFLENKKVTEIASELGVSKQRVSDLKVKAQRKAQKYLTATGLRYIMSN